MNTCAVTPFFSFFFPLTFFLKATLVPRVVTFLAQVTALLCPRYFSPCPKVQIFWLKAYCFLGSFISTLLLSKDFFFQICPSTWTPSFFLIPSVFLLWIPELKLTSGCRSSAFPFLVCCSLLAAIDCWHLLPHAFSAGWIESIASSACPYGGGKECFASCMQETLKNAPDDNCKEVGQKVVKNRHRAILL